VEILSNEPGPVRLNATDLTRLRDLLDEAEWDLDGRWSTARLMACQVACPS
jgi:hypothetical protein